jgi:UDP-N-acetyl-D-mannosaminuronate dehydrogenase
VLATAHKAFDYDSIYREARAIVDSRNAFKKRKGAKITRL